MQIRFHAVMSFAGEEFGADVMASSHDEAYEILSEQYPESSVVQLESPEDTQRREMEIYARVCEDEYDYFEDEEW